MSPRVRRLLRALRVVIACLALGVVAPSPGRASVATWDVATTLVAEARGPRYRIEADAESEGDLEAWRAPLQGIATRRAGKLPAPSEPRPRPRRLFLENQALLC